MKISLFLSLLLLATTVATAAPAETDDLLPPGQAFAVEVHPQGNDRIIAEWEIADGYYLYRKRFRFSTDTHGYQLGEAQLPAGKVHQDKYFGKVETYRNHVRVILPVERDPGAPAKMVLKTVAQGCADLGVCYPPQTQRVTLALGAGASPKARADKRGTPNLNNLGSSASGEFLPPDQAFVFSAIVDGPNRVLARWQIADGYYLYRGKSELSLEDAQGVTLGKVALPKGDTEQDKYFGKVQIWPRDQDVALPLKRRTDGPATVTLKARYQGCATDGICYPPITKRVQLKLPAADETQTAGLAMGGGDSGPGSTPGNPGNDTGHNPGQRAADGTGAGSQGIQSEQGRIAASLSASSTWLTVLTFFGFGLLLTFTPCVLPMIPILSGIIIGEGDAITTRRAFWLSLVYVLAMALTYAVAGVLVGLSGESIQAWFQNPWILSAFAATFVLLALSMFGFYELQVPAAIQGRLSTLSNRQRGGTLVGAGIMGLLSALIVGPCVTAPLIGALIYIADTGNAVLGGLALFALSLGMGAPLLVIGTSAGKLLPKAGPWMDIVRAVFGVLLLGLAIWLLARILPTAVVMVLWGVLLIISSIYMGALERIPSDGSGWFRLWKGAGLVMLVYGGLLLVGAAGGGHSLLQPLTGTRLSGTAVEARDPGLDFRQVKGPDGLQRAIARADRQNNPVMLDFYADWCVSCKEMENFTFSDPSVRQALEDAVLLQTDVTANDARDQALLQRLGLFGPPAILFYSAGGKELPSYRVVGFMPAEQFSRHIDRAFSKIATRH